MGRKHNALKGLIPSNPRKGDKFYEIVMKEIEEFEKKNPKMKVPMFEEDYLS